MVLEKVVVEKKPRKKPVKRAASSRGKPIEKKEVLGKPSTSPDHLLLPHGQLLRGVPVSGKGEYKLPLATDVHTFATRKRTKE
jgi:hypothetical protein